MSIVNIQANNRQFKTYLWNRKIDRLCNERRDDGKDGKEGESEKVNEPQIICMQLHHFSFAAFNYFAGVEKPNLAEQMTRQMS